MEFRRHEFGVQRKLRRHLLSVLAVIVALFVVVFLWYLTRLRPVDAESQARIMFTIPPGESLGVVADRLDEAHLIRAPWAFINYARWKGSTRQIRAGTYALSPSMRSDEILLILTGGTKGELGTTIPEGFTVADIDKLLASRGLAQTGAILNCAKFCQFGPYEMFVPKDNASPGGRVEGYLFPDTYFLGSAVDPVDFLRRMLSTFQKKVFDGLKSDIERSKRSFDDIVIMASLIEKEAANDSERAVIAGILWKRLDAGMILGVDAAVRYAVGKKSSEPLTKADLEVRSPYNLRTQQGLPPGPIANPGLASMNAALHPEESEYYYYLHDNNGVIHYAITNEEHNQNRARFLR